ncbi:MAG: 4a-hydroxytetrahydrobiopterin dehydratase [Gammaproteobacteria bacterium]
MDTTTSAPELSAKHCKPCEGGTPALNLEASRTLLKSLNSWELAENNSAISRTFRFKTFHQTMAFVNALAWIAHQEDHHPDLEVGYSRCKVRYSTHAIGGLSENDFICAAKIDALLGET